MKGMFVVNIYAGEEIALIKFMLSLSY